MTFLVLGGALAFTLSKMEDHQGVVNGEKKLSELFFANHSGC